MVGRTAYLALRIWVFTKALPAALMVAFRALGKEFNPLPAVPYHKITDVEVSRSLLDQRLGFSTLKMFTAGSTSSRAWPLKDQADLATGE